MSEISFSKFEKSVIKCGKVKSILKRLTGERDNRLEIIRKALIEGLSSGDKWMDLALYEFGPDYKEQYEKIIDLKKKLKQNKGQYIQIHWTIEELVCDDSHKQSIIGILDNPPLSIGRKNTGNYSLDCMKYYLKFNFIGKHLFYQSSRNILSDIEGHKFYEPKLELRKNPKNKSSSCNLYSSVFKEVEIVSDPKSKLESKNLILIGNDLFSRITNFLEISEIQGIPGIPELYKHLRSNIMGLKRPKKKKKLFIIKRKKK